MADRCTEFGCKRSLAFVFYSSWRFLALIQILADLVKQTNLFGAPSGVVERYWQICLGLCLEHFRLLVLCFW